MEKTSDLQPQNRIDRPGKAEDLFILKYMTINLQIIKKTFNLLNAYVIDIGINLMVLPFWKFAVDDLF